MLCWSISSISRDRTRQLVAGFVCCATENSPVSDCPRRALLSGLCCDRRALPLDYRYHLKPPRMIGRHGCCPDRGAVRSLLRLIEHRPSSLAARRRRTGCSFLISVSMYVLVRPGSAQHAVVLRRKRKSLRVLLSRRIEANSHSVNAIAFPHR